MKTRPPALFLSAGLGFLTCAASPADDAGPALLAEIMDKPGRWDQMCGGRPALSFDVPVPVYSVSVLPRYYSLGSKEIARLQASRVVMVPALTDSLRAMDWTKPSATVPKESGAHHRSGLKPDLLNPLHLQIIAELNAVEALPELLRLEAQLHHLLEQVESDKKTPLPYQELDQFPEIKASPDEERELEKNYKVSAKETKLYYVFFNRIVQRELLGTITLLLEREQWPGLKERFAADRQRALERDLVKARQILAAAKSRMEGKKEPGDTEENARGWFKHCEDQVKDLEAGTAPVAITSPYTPALRTDIRAIVEVFLKTVPPEKRRGAAAMPKHEVRQ